MATSDTNTSELWVAGFAFAVPAVIVPFEGVILLDTRTFGADESPPTAMAVVGMMLALWWFDSR